MQTFFICIKDLPSQYNSFFWKLFQSILAQNVSFKLICFDGVGNIELKNIIHNITKAINHNENKSIYYVPYINYEESIKELLLSSSISKNDIIVELDRMGWFLDHVQIHNIGLKLKFCSQPNAIVCGRCLDNKTQQVLPQQHCMFIKHEAFMHVANESFNSLQELMLTHRQKLHFIIYHWAVYCIL